MNRNMRLAIESMIERRVISANLLFLCLARLNEIIMTRAANNTKQEQQRVIIAKAALSIGVDKETIRDKMKSIDQSCFPTDRKITEICEYIESGYCGIDDSAIPDKWLKYKSAEQIEHDMQRQKAKRETQQTSRSTFECSDPDSDSDKEETEEWFAQYAAEHAEQQDRPWEYKKRFSPNIFDRNRVKSFITALEIKYNPDKRRDLFVSDAEFEDYCELWGKNIDEVVSEITENGAIPFTDDRVKWFMSELEKEGFQYDKPLQC